MAQIPPAQNHQVSYVGNGYFQLDGKSMNLNDLMNLVQANYRDGLNAVMGEIVNETNDQAKEMQALSALKAHARVAKNNKDDAHDDEGSDATFTLPGYAGKYDYDTWCKKFGIQQTDVDPKSSTTTWKSKWDDNIANVDDAIKNVQFTSDQSNLDLKNTNSYISTSVSEQAYEIRQNGQNNQAIFQ